MCYSVAALCMYERIFHLTKHLHLDRSLHAVIHFVTFAVHIRIRTNAITPVLILCARCFVALAFAIRIHIMYKWNLSFNLHVSGPDQNYTWEGNICIGFHVTRFNFIPSLRHFFLLTFFGKVVIHLNITCVIAAALVFQPFYNWNLVVYIIII